jgi:hypothetical protein
VVGTDTRFTLSRDGLAFAPSTSSKSAGPVMRVIRGTTSEPEAAETTAVTSAPPSARNATVPPSTSGAGASTYSRGLFQDTFSE